MKPTPADLRRGIPMAVLLGLEHPAFAEKLQPEPPPPPPKKPQRPMSQAGIAARDAAIIDMLRRAGKPITGDDLFAMMELFAPEALGETQLDPFKARLAMICRRGMIKRMPGRYAEWALPK